MRNIMEKVLEQQAEKFNIFIWEQLEALWINTDNIDDYIVEQHNNWYTTTYNVYKKEFVGDLLVRYELKIKED